MAKIITFGLQKGGVSKTTTTGVIAHLLSNDNSSKKSVDGKGRKNKVLAIDMDSQGNLTELLTDQSANNFFNHSVFEAIAYKDPEKYIYEINKNLHILPSNNFLASYAKWLYTETIPHTDKRQVSVPYKGSVTEQFKLMIDMVRNKYDYILIDTPPALSEQTTNSLVASDYVVVLFEASKFCYSAIPNFMETIEHIQGFSNLKALGILRTLNDNRRKDAHFFNRLIENDYPEMIFETIITRKASTGRLPLYGFEKDNKELEEGLLQFKVFYKELLKRIKESEDKAND